jgi:hypothetical protein
MNKLHNLILSVIQNPNSPAWFPVLTEELVNYGWQQLYDKYGLHTNNYSTEAVLNQGLIQKPIEPIISVKPFAKALPSVNICPIPDKIALLYSDIGAKPYAIETLQTSAVLQCIQDALGVLSEIPTVYETISLLIANLHILQPEDDDFDISFSLPDIPFSIFFSVPSKRMDNDTLRVAEGILHEAMHLQLTLIEHSMPLVIDTNEEYFSPWKNEYRHPRGLLHAIYVFCVITQFFENLIQQNISKSCKQYLFMRQNLISNQFKEISGFLNSPIFTEAGNYISEYLFLIQKAHH